MAVIRHLFWTPHTYANALSSEAPAKFCRTVTPTKVGVQNILKRRHSGFRWNDVDGLLQEAQANRISEGRGVLQDALSPGQSPDRGPARAQLRKWGPETGEDCGTQMPC